MLNQANPDQQVVKKMVSMSQGLSDFVVKKIGETDKELDPQGIKMAKEARKTIIKVAYINKQWLMQIAMSGARSMGMGGDFVAKTTSIAGPLGRSMDSCCELYSAMNGYTEAKEITLGEDTATISKNEENLFNN